MCRLQMAVFIYTLETSSETIFGIAAGSGITPVMGIENSVERNLKQ